MAFRPYRQAKYELRLRRDLLRARFEARPNDPRFAGLQAYAMFIGYPRSGHSLVGSLLDAHPEAMIANEADALKYVPHGISREGLLHLLWQNSRRTAARGRTQTGYSYVVPGAWQGRAEPLHVIGDKRGGNSTRRLARDPGLLPQLRERVDLPLRVIHITRNPYDILTTIALRHCKMRPACVTEAVLAERIEGFFRMAETIARVRADLEPAELLEMRSEDLIAAPEARLEQLCRGLGLRATAAYLAPAAAIVYSKPKLTRKKVSWPAGLVERVAREMEHYPFLAGYTFEE